MHGNCSKGSATQDRLVVLWLRVERFSPDPLVCRYLSSGVRFLSPVMEWWGKVRQPRDGMMCIEDLFPRRELQMWYASVCEDHLWCRRKYVMFEKVLMWPLWKEDFSGGGGNGSDQVGVTMPWPSRHDAHTTDRRTLQAGTLAGSPSYGHIPWYWWQARCTAAISTSRKRYV